MRVVVIGIIVLAVTLGLDWKNAQLPSISSTSLEPKVVMLSGGTSGLGRATVLHLLKSGDTVITCGRSMAKIELLKMEAAELGAASRLLATTCDVASEQSIHDFVHSFAAPLLGDQNLSVLVNCAGVLRVGDPLLAMDLKTFDEPFAVNLRGVFLLTREAWPLLRKSTYPLIINVGSVVEHPGFAQAFHSIYSISKTALRAYSSGLRQEVSLFGGSVVHLKVGSFSSSLHNAFNDAQKNLETYTEGGFARFGRSLNKHLQEALRMVSERPSEEFASGVHAILHTSPASLRGEYWLNVSWLERLVEFLPQWVLDRIIVGKFL